MAVVQSPYTGTVPIPTSDSGKHIASAGGIDLGEGSQKQSSAEVGQLASTYSPQGGVPVPMKYDQPLRSDCGANVPNIEPSK